MSGDITSTGTTRQWRLTSWNCQGAFRTKFSRILALDPDVVVVQESEPIDRLDDLLPEAYSKLWFGSDGENKGVLVLAAPGVDVQAHRAFDPAANFRHVIPLTVTTEQESLVLLAVYAMKSSVSREDYVGQVHLGLDHYEHILGTSAVIIGDFNSNARWDRPSVRGHTDLVVRLAEAGMRSAYHSAHGEEHGGESVPTYFVYRREDKGHHIDYCFLSEQLINRMTTMSIGQFKDWSDITDHVPLIVDIAREAHRLGQPASIRS